MFHLLFFIHLLLIEHNDATCTIPFHPPNGQRTCTYYSTPSRLICELKCNVGYYSDGPTRVTSNDCKVWLKDDGSRAGYFRCVRNDSTCQIPARPSNGEWNCSIRKVWENRRKFTKTICFSKCMPGYFSKTTQRIVCYRNVWSNLELTREYPLCEDIDECLLNASLNHCQHNCHNTPGSYYCSCRRGYRLVDGRNCQDIDECSYASLNHCPENCQNTPGSYHCPCPRGYKLLDDRRCHDVDECSSASPCHHNCHNSAGSFYCSCQPGYRLVDGRNCQDVDECFSGSRSHCHQNCHNTPGSFHCSCRRGYRLIDDRHCEGCPKNSYEDGDHCKACPRNAYTESIGSISILDCKCHPGFMPTSEGGLNCQDIDECKEKNFGCSHTCLNTPGGAHCTCADGFEVDADNKTCTDIDECSLQNGGCEGLCHNTIGGFSCSCPSGYNSAEKNIYSCTDIDECAANNGNCSQICNNFDGGHYCSCNEGYHLDRNRKSCKMVVCRDIVVPRNSHMKCHEPRMKKGVYNQDNFDGNPTGYSENTTCDFKCKTGYEPNQPSSGIRCIDGQWIGTVPQCIALACPPLQKPDHGDIYPESCIFGQTTVGQNCSFNCDPGYKRKGKRLVKCTKNLTWRPIEMPFCEPDRKEPYIICPEDQSMVLPHGNSSIWLHPPTPICNTEYYIQEPDWMNVTDLDGMVEFPAGRTDIKFIAVNPKVKGMNHSCVTTVYVSDSEPPVITGCPKSFDLDIKDIQEEKVHWAEPSITDNVGVTVVTKTLEPNSTLSPGTHIVKYIAFDEAGNFGECLFHINVTSVICSNPVGPLNGDANCMEVFGGKLCEPVCDSGFVFPTSEDHVYICSNNGQWSPSNVIPDCIDECPPNLQWSWTSHKCENPIIPEDPLSFDVSPK